MVVTMHDYYRYGIDFDYVNNYDPITNSVTKEYKYSVKENFEIKPVSIILENVQTNSIEIQTGFYPKVINDFNVFYNGYDLYSGYTNDEINEYELYIDLIVAVAVVVVDKHKQTMESLIYFDNNNHHFEQELSVAELVAVVLVELVYYFCLKFFYYLILV